MLNKLLRKLNEWKLLVDKRRMLIQEENNRLLRINISKYVQNRDVAELQNFLQSLKILIYDDFGLAEFLTSEFGIACKFNNKNRIIKIIQCCQFFEPKCKEIGEILHKSYFGSILTEDDTKRKINTLLSLSEYDSCDVFETTKFINDRIDEVVSEFLNSSAGSSPVELDRWLTLLVNIREYIRCDVSKKYRVLEVMYFQRSIERIKLHNRNFAMEDLIYLIDKVIYRSRKMKLNIDDTIRSEAFKSGVPVCEEDYNIIALHIKHNLQS